MHNLSIDVFKFRFNLIFNDNCHDALTDHDLFNEFKKGFDTEEEADEYLFDSNAITFTLNKKNLYVMVLPENPKPGVVAHECFHMACLLFEKKATSLTYSTEETWAHVIDYLVETITNLIPE